MYIGISQIVGMSQIKGLLKSKAKGLSPRYASPEAFKMMEERDQNQAATLEDTVIDIYAFGIILWELIERKIPWEGKSYSEIRECVLNGERPEICKENECSDDKLISTMLLTLRNAWFHDPTQRPTFHQMSQDLQLVYYLQHPTILE